MRREMMAFFMGIPQNYSVFVPRGGRLLVSRSQRYLHRKLIFCRANQLDSALDGSSHEDCSSTLVGVIENITNLPETGSPIVPVAAPPQCGSLDSMRLKAMLRVSGPGPSGSLPPQIVYLLELGFDLKQIKVITCKFPHFAYYTLEGKIRPLIEILLDLGVSKSDLPGILIKCPRLCGMSLSENLPPTMAFLETLGVDKEKWPKLISNFPALLNYSRRKIEATVEFLYEVGVSKENMRKIFTRCPAIIGLSIEDQLQPKVEYFQSLGVEVVVLLRHCPQVMGLSIEANLKPITEFFVENGLSIEEVGTMISKYGALYSYSLKDNLVPKWEFFLTTHYSRHDLVKSPQYFGYSFKERIKPRYDLMKKSGVKMPLGQLLIRNDHDFELLLKKKIEKLQSDETCNLSDTTQ